MSKIEYSGTLAAKIELNTVTKVNRWNNYQENSNVRLRLYGDRYYYETYNQKVTKSNSDKFEEYIKLNNKTYFNSTLL